MNFPEKFSSFEEFYPFYLSEHRSQMCKLFHFMGSCLFLSTLVGIFLTGHWYQFWLLPVFGYGFAWIGHFFFEKNKPASSRFPIYNFRGDLMMFLHLVNGRLAFDDNAPLK